MIAVILAGGQGRRMGGVDKGEIKLGDQRMVDAIYAKLSQQDAQVWVSGSHDYGLGVEVISDLELGPKGPVAGIYAIFKTLENCGEVGFFTVPVDGPNLPGNLLTRLYDKSQSTIASDDTGTHPAFAWWRFEDLRSAWGQLDLTESISLKYLAKLTSAQPISWDDGSLFANINTANDLADYLNKS